MVKIQLFPMAFFLWIENMYALKLQIESSIPLFCNSAEGHGNFCKSLFWPELSHIWKVIANTVHDGIHVHNE